MRSCTMRVVLSNPSPRWVEAARRAGAEHASLEAESLLITSSPERRLDILRAIESAGAQVGSFATRDLSLEDIYLRYIHDEESHATHP